jgi:hypothetical protein
MLQMKKALFGASLALAAMAGIATTASAEVSASLHIGGRPAVWYGPPGACARYSYPGERPFGAPWRNCGYPTWHGPIFIDGRWRHGPFYYHARYGERYYWWRGAWRRSEWRGVPR